MSTKGRSYNPRHSTPSKQPQNVQSEEHKDEEFVDSINKFDEVPILSPEETKNAPEQVTEQEVEQQTEEEDLTKLIDEIHKEVVDFGFKEEVRLKEEKEIAEKLSDVIANQNSGSKPYEYKDTSREEIPDIVVPKNIRNKGIYEKEFDTLAKAVTESIQQSKGPVYKLRRNEQTGRSEVVTSLVDKEEPKIIVDIDKQQVIGNMLKTSTTDIMKVEVEIYIHEEIMKSEFDPVKMQNAQRKIDTLKENLEYLNKRVNILKNMIM